mmetsp:Transcript_3243/g.7202  ORF Transcript_3243/g.7202 Transcript_3243/m.7202 type:complete len:592 (+) Transcript_3243:47-1822(+)
MEIGADLSGLAGLNVDGVVTGGSRSAASSSEAAMPRKRKVDVSMPSSSSKKVAIGEDLPDEIDQAEIDQMLEQADTLHIEGMNEGAVKRMVLQLERKIKMNQEQRIKFSDDPEKFLKSELDLDEAIKKFKTLATHPQLYGEMLQLNVLPMLLGTMNHANTDIAVDIFEVLNELTDAEVMDEVDDPEGFINALFEAELPTMAVEVLLRLNEEASEEEAEAVSNFLSMIENLAEIAPSETANRFARVPKFLPWLLKRVSIDKKMDSNKANAAETLGVILYNSTSAVDAMGKKDPDGLDTLLRGISGYRKMDPADSEEVEFMENMFDSLCLLMLVESHQVNFGKKQGLELMIRMMKQKNKAALPALKLTNHALRNCAANCQIFVDKLGLKVLFGMFMKKGAGQKTKQAAKDSEEHLVSIIQSLCRYCTGTPVARVLNKFTEFQFEKLERLVELHEEYALSVMRFDEQRQHGLLNSIDKELDLDEEEALYRDQCDAGLFTLQQVDITIVRLANMGNRQVAEELATVLDSKGVELREVFHFVLQYCKQVEDTAMKEAEELRKFLRSLASNSGQSAALEDELKVFSKDTEKADAAAA